MAVLLETPDQDVVLPGAAFYFEIDPGTTVPVSQGNTVLMPFTADWGPDNAPVEIPSYPSYAQKFGTTDTVGRRRVFGAFLGEGTPGAGGAGAVIGYRLAGSAAAPAAHTLQNSTPAAALTITGAYDGTRGNGLSLTTRAGTVSGTDQLVVIENSQEVETYQYPTGAVATLAAMINATASTPKPSLVTAASLVTGTALAHVANVSLTGGNDGTTLVVGDWTDMFDALAYEPFGVFAAAGLTDSSILAALYAWQVEVAGLGKPFQIIEGGPLDEAFIDHQTRATARNTPDAIVVGTGSISDTTLTTDGSAVILPTSEGIARVAGAVARRGPAIDMINVRFSGWSIIDGATIAQATIAATSGMTLLTRDSDPVSPTKINLGVTSYWNPDVSGLRPLWHYSNVKFVLTDHALETDIAADQENGDLIGLLNSSSRARDIVIGRAAGILKSYISRGIIQPNATIMLDPDQPNTDDSDEIGLLYDIWDTRGLRVIRNRIRLH